MHTLRMPTCFKTGLILISQVRHNIFESELLKSRSYSQHLELKWVYRIHKVPYF